MQQLFSVEVEEAVQCLAVNSDDSFCAVGTCEPGISIISNQNGQIIRILSGHKGGTNNIQFLSATLLVSVGEDGNLKLWDAAKGELTQEVKCPGIDADKTSDGHTVQNLAVSHDKKLVACSAGKSIHVLNMRTMEITKYEKIVNEGIVEDLNFTKQGVLLGAFYACVALLKPGENESWMKLEYPGTNCYTLDQWIHTNGHWIVGGTFENNIHIWHQAPGSQELVELTARGYSGRVTKVRFHPQGRFLASCGGDCLLVWDFEGQGPAGSTPSHLPCDESQITDFDWQGRGQGQTQGQGQGLGDSHLLCAGTKGGEVCVFSIEMSSKGLQAPVGRGVVEGEDEDEVTCLQWGQQGNVYVGHISGMVRKWNVGNWQQRLKEILERQIRAQYAAYQQMSAQQQANRQQRPY